MASDLILASGSPFRRKMLTDAGVAFRVVVADVDEALIKSTLLEDNPEIDAADVADVLARAKAEQVSAIYPEALVIGADQVLVCEGELFSKPTSMSIARQQLLRLRGRTHSLPTAVALAVDGDTVWSALVAPTLTMRAFSHAFLDDYLAAEGTAVLQTVGGYALEGRGGQLFEALVGDYFSVIGLPLLPLLGALRARGYLTT